MTDLIDRAFGKLYDLADKLPDNTRPHPVRLADDRRHGSKHSIMCECQHKRCAGRTIPIINYVERFEEL